MTEARALLDALDFRFALLAFEAAGRCANRKPHETFEDEFPAFKTGGT